jgi:hypothetical protein
MGQRERKAPSAGQALFEQVPRLEDPRVERSKVHALVAIVPMALFRGMCGAAS